MDIAAYFLSDLCLNLNASLGTDSKMLNDATHSRVERGPSSRFIIPKCFVRRELTIVNVEREMQSNLSLG